MGMEVHWWNVGAAVLSCTCIVRNGVTLVWEFTGSDAFSLFPK